MIHGGNVWQGNSPADWLDYSANIRPEGAPDWVKEALLRAMDSLSYYPDPRMKRARRSLAEYLSLAEDHVLPTAGGVSAIDMATHLDTSGMLLATPCFAEYAMQSANRGKIVHSASILKARHAVGDPCQQIAPRIFEGCTVWLCNPLNPVGCSFTREAILRLLKRVEAASGWLIVDEAFIEYCPEHSVTDLIEHHERLLVTGSLTKILGVPGVRLGYLCAQPQVLEKLRRYQLAWELNCFAEAVACALPEHAEDIRRDALVNVRRRENLRAELENLGAFVYPSDAAFLLADFGRPVDEMMLRLRKDGILVRSCMNFEGIDDGCHLRLAVKGEASNARLIQSIKEALQCAASH